MVRFVPVLPVCLLLTLFVPGCQRSSNEPLEADDESPSSRSVERRAADASYLIGQQITGETRSDNPADRLQDPTAANIVGSSTQAVGSNCNDDENVCEDDDDCDDGLFCNGAEVCDNECCVEGEEPCDDSSCDEEADQCIECLDDADCDDDRFCNGRERCEGGSCQQGDLPCLQSCDEENEVCGDCVDDDDCDDGRFCNGIEHCRRGSCHPGDIPCQQFCDEGQESCGDCESDDDCDDGLFCTGVERCVAGSCVAGEPPCTEGNCDEDGQVCTECVNDADCDDGLFCNGEESCDAGSCGRGDFACAQVCDEQLDRCTECLSDFECDDGEFCSGVETCVDNQCEPGASPCPHSCDEEEDVCISFACLTDADCDDGLFCNGAETCADSHCIVGADPCPDSVCREDGATCEGVRCDGAQEPFGDGEQIGTLMGHDVNEASGLVASRQNPSVLWTHNDNAEENEIFAIHVDGTLLGVYTVGTYARDPEDVAIGPGPEDGVDYVYLGDIGDNQSVRSTIFVKRFPEPSVDAEQFPLGGPVEGVDIITLAFPLSGPTAPSHKDSETLLVDPINGDIYIVTKRTSSGLIYRAAYPQSTTSVVTLEYVAAIPWNWTTGGDVSPDGSSIIIRRYSWLEPPASVWYRPHGSDFWDAFVEENRCDVTLQSEPLGEAICWDPDGIGFLTVSEDEEPGAEIPIWYYPRDGG